MIAIDPGANGGIATNYAAGSPVCSYALKMPATDREICDFLNPNQGTPGLPQDVYLEDIVKYAGRNMPSSSMAVYAGSFAFIRGVLTAFGHRIIIVPPKKWQKALGLGDAKSHASKTAWKNHLKNKAEQLYPQIKVTLATADALLILEAARRGLIG